MFLDSTILYLQNTDIIPNPVIASPPYTKEITFRVLAPIVKPIPEAIIKISATLLFI